MTSTINEFTEKTFKEYLKTGLLSELASAKTQFSETEMLSFDLGIFPWHASFECSFLTTQEYLKDNEVKEDIACWKYYNFNDDKKNEKMSHIGKWMQSQFENTLDAKRFYRLSADTLAAPEILALLAEFKCNKHFYVSIYDPDEPNSHNYYTGRISEVES